MNLFFIAIAILITPEFVHSYYPNFGQASRQNQCPRKDGPMTLYPVLMEESLLQIDANDMHGGKIDELDKYCPKTEIRDGLTPQIIIRAWKSKVILTSIDSDATFDSVIRCKFLTPSGQTGIVQVSRIFVDPLKRFSVMVFCVPSGGKQRWVVHSPKMTPFSARAEKIILEFLKLAGLDTTNVFRPDFSKCVK